MGSHPESSLGITNFCYSSQDTTSVLIHYLGHGGDSFQSTLGLLQYGSLALSQGISARLCNSNYSHYTFGPGKDHQVGPES